MTCHDRICLAKKQLSYSLYYFISYSRETYHPVIHCFMQAQTWGGWTAAIPGNLSQVTTSEMLHMRIMASSAKFDLLARHIESNQPQSEVVEPSSVCELAVKQCVGPSLSLPLCLVDRLRNRPSAMVAWGSSLSWPSEDLCQFGVTSQYRCTFLMLPRVAKKLT